MVLINELISKTFAPLNSFRSKHSLIRYSILKNYSTEILLIIDSVPATTRMK
jgi:hypothetical protein